VDTGMGVEYRFEAAIPNSLAHLAIVADVRWLAKLLLGEQCGRQVWGPMINAAT